MRSAKSVAYFLLVMKMCTTANAQIGTQVMKPEVDTSSAAPFYKWEFGIDVLPLVDKSRDAFGYILKRNFKGKSGRKALRLKFLPRFGNSSLDGDVTTSAINLAVGYEWQRTHGRFATLYGIEPSIRSSRNIITPSNSRNKTEVFDTYIGANAFIGGRYYLGKHFAITIESHAIYNYHIIDGSNLNLVSSFKVREHIFFINPIHALYVNYHF